MELKFVSPKIPVIKLQISDIDENDNNFAIAVAADGDDYTLVLRMVDSQ